MGKNCPSCDSNTRYKTKRPLKLKMIPYTSLYKCMSCNTYYIYSRINDRSYVYKRTVLAARN